MFKLIKLIVIFLIVTTADSEEIQVNQALESSSGERSSSEGESGESEKSNDNDANLQKEHLDIELKTKFEIELFKMINAKKSNAKSIIENIHTIHVYYYE
jgi:hypothetical protein